MKANNLEGCNMDTTKISNGLQNLSVKDGEITKPIVASSNVEEARNKISATLVGKLASLLEINPNEIKSTAALSDLGLDSFLASEFENVSCLLDEMFLMSQSSTYKYPCTVLLSWVYTL